ncbi:hypothetical protein GCM10010232_62450 [Streptomyces amakusaensis]|uniref:Uncharacterized protein n=1 Tax=Streptomyces amakusaensis TaxID=67271 RepID=A0ABW0ATV5_9ACTN
MPTYEALYRFTADHRTGQGFRPGLRMKRVRTTPGGYELSWSMGAGCPGRATWAYGTPVRPGEQHIIWRRIGTHDILTGP